MNKDIKFIQYLVPLPILITLCVFTEGVFEAFIGFILIVYSFITINMFIRIYNKLTTNINDLDIRNREMNHRVKNSVAILTSIIELKKITYSDDRSCMVLNEIRDRTLLISKIHEKMYKYSQDTVKLSNYIQEIIDMTNNFYGSEITVIYNITDMDIRVKTAIDLALIIQEAFTNSIKYAFSGVEDKRFNINITDDSGMIKAIISDNGCGFDNGHLDSESFGTGMMQSLVDQYNGKIRYESVFGTHIYITIFT